MPRMRLRAAASIVGLDSQRPPAGGGLCSGREPLHETTQSSLTRREEPVYILHCLPYSVRGTGYAPLFLDPCASVYTQLGQSCSAATRLSLHSGRDPWAAKPFVRPAELCRQTLSRTIHSIFCQGLGLGLGLGPGPPGRARE